MISKLIPNCIRCNWLIMQNPLLKYNFCLSNRHATHMPNKVHSKYMLIKRTTDLDAYKLLCLFKKTINSI